MSMFSPDYIEPSLSLRLFIGTASRFCAFDVREWAEARPEWLKVMPPPPTADPALLSLHAGERSALALGISLHADLILIDERKGANVAR